jgi:hypothetical protein
MALQFLLSPQDLILFFCSGMSKTLSVGVLVVIKCIYLSSPYLHFIKNVEDMCLLLTSSMSAVDLPFQEYRMTEKHYMDYPCISSLCPK